MVEREPDGQLDQHRQAAEAADAVLGGHRAALVEVGAEAVGVGAAAVALGDAPGGGAGRGRRRAPGVRPARRGAAGRGGRGRRAEAMPSSQVPAASGRAPRAARPSWAAARTAARACVNGSSRDMRCSWDEEGRVWTGRAGGRRVRRVRERAGAAGGGPRRWTGRRARGSTSRPTGRAASGDGWPGGRPGRRDAEQGRGGGASAASTRTDSADIVGASTDAARTRARSPHDAPARPRHGPGQEAATAGACGQTSRRVSGSS